MRLVSSNEKKRVNLIKGLKGQTSEVLIPFLQDGQLVRMISQSQILSSECSTNVVIPVWLWGRGNTKRLDTVWGDITKLYTVHIGRAGASSALFPLLLFVRVERKENKTVKQCKQKWECGLLVKPRWEMEPESLMAWVTENKQEWNVWHCGCLPLWDFPKLLRLLTSDGYWFSKNPPWAAGRRMI